MKINDRVIKISLCRACKKDTLRKIISLGPQPNANSYVLKENLEKEEIYYPLDVYFCTNCNFLQLGHEIKPEILFDDYVYVSSTSPIFVKHFLEYAAHIHKKFDLQKKSLVVDVGSNDGILLKGFKNLGASVIGVDPVKEIAAVAEKDGIKTIKDFFSIKVAKNIERKYGKAQIICANNTFAQISNLDQLLEGVKYLLAKDGVFIIEVPYLPVMLKNKYFDLIYHEHHSFPAIKPLQTLFNRFGMEIFDVEGLPVHGGTVRIFVKNKNAKHLLSGSVQKHLNLEKKLKLDNAQTYINFFNDIQHVRLSLLKLLINIKGKNKTIAGYGAPAKGNTLLNYFNIGTETIDFIIDDSSWKQGRFTPGKRIPIVPSSFLNNKKIDYMLILAWNFSEAIIKKNKSFSDTGGKFIIPFPKPKII